MDLVQYGQPTGNFIVQASFDGRLKSNEGFLSATGDLCSLTASSGKDLYLTNAQIVFDTNAGAGSIVVADEVVLKVNGTIIETAKISYSGASSLVYTFRNLFHKVSATQILKIEVITIDSESDVEGFIQAVEVPTGENPITYRGA